MSTVAAIKGSRYSKAHAREEGRSGVMKFIVIFPVSAASDKIRLTLDIDDRRVGSGVYKFKIFFFSRLN